MGDTVRTIAAVYGPVDPYVHETHSHQEHTLVQMPARLVYLPIGGMGWCIEIGPYTFGPDDIEVLREAIADYDRSRRA